MIHLVVMVITKLVMARQNLMTVLVVRMAIILRPQTAHAMRAKPIVKHVMMLVLVPIVSMAIIWPAAHAFNAILTVKYVHNMVLVLLIAVTMTLLATFVPMAFMLTMPTAHVLRATLPA